MSTATMKEEGRGVAIFRLQSDLWPQMLKKENSYQEAVGFVEMFEVYLSNGYGRLARIPQDMIALQLQPFVNAILWKFMKERGVKSNNLDEVKVIIMQVAYLHNLVHDRRMDLLKLKKGDMQHSEFLHKIEQIISSTYYENWFWGPAKGGWK